MVQVKTTQRHKLKWHQSDDDKAGLEMVGHNQNQEDLMFN